MSKQLSDVLREHSKGVYMFYCPACKYAHLIYTKEFYGSVLEDGSSIQEGPAWTFDGNVEKPTFHPSVRHFHSARTEEDGSVTPERTTCHYFVQGGRIVYQNDFPNALAGQTVDMQKFPERYFGHDDQ